MNITLDSATTFETGSIIPVNGQDYPGTVWLDSTHFVVAYSDAGDSNYGKVVCASVSGVTPTFGTIATFSAATTGDVCVSRLDDTHFVIAYRVGSAGLCVVCSVSGTTITPGSAAAIGSDVSYLTVCGMDDTHFVVSYTLSSPYSGCVKGASVSGTTITFGSADTYSSTSYSAGLQAICSLDATHFVVAYLRSLTPYTRMVVCGTLSGNTVTVAEDGGEDWGSSAADVSIAALDSSHFIIAYRALGLNTGRVVAGSVSGTTITIDPDAYKTFETGYTYVSSVSALSAVTFVVAFADASDSGKGKAIIGSVSGTTITIVEDGATTFESGSCTNGVDVDSIDGIYFAISVVDGGDSFKGKSIIGKGPAVYSGAVDISTAASVSAQAVRRKPGIAALASSTSLSLAGNRIAGGVVAISAVPSLVAVGWGRSTGTVAIIAVSSLEATPFPFVCGTCAIQSVPSVTIDGDRIASGVLPISIVSSLTADPTKVVLGVAAIQAVASVLAGAMKISNGVVTITAVSSVEAAALAYITQAFGYTGTLTAGDVLVIDVDEQTVELNGANATQYFTGEFPQLYVGTNELRWEDGGEVPDVDFETKHKPRYL